MTTDEIDKAVHKMTIDNGAYPSPLTYGETLRDPRVGISLNLGLEQTLSAIVLPDVTSTCRKLPQKRMHISK